MKIEKSYTFVNKHMITYEWKINKISSYREKSDDNVTINLNLESPQFSMGVDEEKKWHLKLISENKEFEDKTWMSLLLYYHSTKTSGVKTKYVMFILNDKNERVNASEFKKVFSDNGDHWICNEFVKKSDLEEKEDELLPYDTLTIGIELTIYDDDTSTFSSSSIILKEPTSQVADDYKRLFKSMEGSDVVIKVKDEIFKAHKTMLMARCKMFFEMFTLATDNKDNLITLDNIAPDVFKSFLEFIYTDEVSDIDVVVEDLLEVADKYLLDSLKELCAESLFKLLKVNNAVRFLSLAERHNVPQLSTHVTDFIILNVEDVMNTPEFKIMEKSDPSLALVLFEKLAALKTTGSFVVVSNPLKKAD